MKDNELLIALRKDGSTFAMQMVDAYYRYGKWTDRQRFCVERIYNKVSTQANAIASFKGIIDLFEKPKINGLKRPSLHFIFNANKVLISKAPDTRKDGKPHPNAGCLYLKFNGSYCGKISPSGQFDAVGNLTVPKQIMDFLQAFSADPAKVGSEYGKQGGCCCFCGSNLTDERSVNKGYGPVCSQNWSLPWGDASISSLSPQPDLGQDAPILELTAAAKRSITP